MQTEVTIQAKDGSGAFRAFVSRPDQAKPAPAVILIQEIFGVNKNMRDLCNTLAQKGYLAICPDLFWRQEPGIQLTDQSEAEWKRAFELFQGFNVDQGVEDLKATLGFIRKDKNCSGKVGTIGYCLGGKLAYLMATRSDADCNVSYYGVGIEALLEESPAIKNPLLMHIAEKDKFVPPTAQQKIIAALSAYSQVEIETYTDMDHAFTRMGGEHYNAAAAEKAHARTDAFLEKHLRKS